MTTEEMKAERRVVVDFLTSPGGEVLVKYLRRRWRDGLPGDTADRRLGRIEALFELEDLRGAR